MVTVMMVMAMVGNGKCRRSSRYQHHKKKGQGSLPHEPIDTPRSRGWQDNFLCRYLAVRI
jgi:hypothetical protein